MEPVTLRSEHVQTLSQLTFLKQYLERQLQALDNQMVSLLNVAYCVDVSKGDWHLDLQNGVLTHDDTNSQPG